MIERLDQQTIPVHLKVTMQAPDESSCMEEIKKRLAALFGVYSIGPVRKNDKDVGVHFFCNGLVSIEDNLDLAQTDVDYVSERKSERVRNSDNFLS